MMIEGLAAYDTNSGAALRTVRSPGFPYWDFQKGANLNGLRALPVANRSVGQPMAYLRSTLSGLAGLAALGADDGLIQLSGPGMVEAPGDAPATDWARIGVAANSEIGFLTNLWRASQGKPPLPTSATAPAVNVGISDDLKKIIVAGGLGVGALVLVRMLKKRR